MTCHLFLCCNLWSGAALRVEIQSRNFENERLLKDIDELKATMLSAISIGS